MQLKIRFQWFLLSVMYLNFFVKPYKKTFNAILITLFKKYAYVWLKN